MKVLVCAGGTGGHIYPALATTTALQQQGVACDDILWIGTKGKMEEELVPPTGLRLETVAGGAVVSSVSLPRRILNVMKAIGSIGVAAKYIRQFKPDVMFMTGGYTAVPVTIASWLHRVPVVIYLPDVEPGSTIKAMTRFATKIACTTPQSDQFLPADKMVVTGYPVRAELRDAAQMSQEEALAVFDLTPERPTLFVFGGSRGAWNINKALLGALPQLLTQIQIIHVSGTTTWPEVQAHSQTLPDDLQAYYRPYAYLHEAMGAAFRAADLTLARAGASMLGECPAFGLPSILVPLTFAWRYQKVNADFLTERGAAIQSTDEALPDEIVDLVMGLLNDGTRLEAMRNAAKALDVVDAAANLAQVVTAVAHKEKVVI